MESSPEPASAKPRRLRARLLLLHGVGSLLLASLMAQMYLHAQVYLFGYAGLFALASVLAAVALWKDDVNRWRVAVALYWLASFLVNVTLALMDSLGAECAAREGSLPFSNELGSTPISDITRPYRLDPPLS